MKRTLLKDLTPVYKPSKLENVKITSSNSANYFFRKIAPVEITDREFSLALHLNRANLTIGYTLLSIGGINGTVMDVRILMRDAILNGASGIILCHNHPSGQLQPSQADRTITSKMVDAGKLLDIEILDHIILTETSYYSFADEGNL